MGVAAFADEAFLEKFFSVSINEVEGNVFVFSAAVGDGEFEFFSHYFGLFTKAHLGGEDGVIDLASWGGGLSISCCRVGCP